MLRRSAPAPSATFLSAMSTTAPSSVTALVGLQVATPPFTDRTFNPITSIEHRGVSCAQNSLGVGDCARLTLVTWSILLSLDVGLSAATLDESKLPPPAKERIDFTRDIKPILQTSCLRCHGPEKPKSRFRLDNRSEEHTSELQSHSFISYAVFCLKQ